MIGIWLAGIIAAVILLLALLTVELELLFSQEAGDGFLKIKATLWPGLSLSSGRINFADLRAKSEGLFFRSRTEETGKDDQGVKHVRLPHLPKLALLKLAARSLWPVARNILRANRAFCRTIHCKKLDWRTEFGFSDPAYTGVAAGLLWAAKFGVLRNLTNTLAVDFDQPHFEVLPQFQEPCFNVRLECILVLRGGHLMLIGLKQLSYIGRGAWNFLVGYARPLENKGVET